MAGDASESRDSISERSESKPILNIGNFCCVAKHYFSQKNAIVDTLEIIPRVVICKKPMKRGQHFEQFININNAGLYPRKLTYFSDSPDEMIIQIPAREQDKYLDPDTNVELRIIISPIRKTDINRRRHLYIQSEHPNITIEVPFLVIQKNAVPCLPEKIKFPSSVPTTKSSYEIAIYNPTNDPVPVIIKCLSPKIKFTIPTNKIRKKDYLRVLIQFDVVSMSTFSEALKVKFSGGSYLAVPVEHVPILYSIHLNYSHIMFEQMKYDRELKKQFTICNESKLELSFNIKFLTEESPSEKNHENSEPNQSLVNTANSEVSTLTEHGVTSSDPTTLPFGKSDYRHFTISSMAGSLKPNSAKKFGLTFQPVMDPACDFDESKESPFFVKTKLGFSVYHETVFNHQFLVAMGYIIGPAVELTPEIIDLRRVYLGEEQCDRIKALNVDGLVDATVDFVKVDENNMSKVTITPLEGYTLRPCQAGIFQLSFFSHDTGKFIVKLRFKVKNGKRYTVLIKGYSEPVRMKLFPDMIEMGSIPVAVPQKRTILVVNPLSVPITLKCTVPDDGSEAPLVLNIRDVDELLPITVKDPYKKLIESIGDDDEAEDAASIQMTSKECSSSSYRSLSSFSSTYSAAFEDEIIESMEQFAAKVVANIRRKKCYDKTEPATRCIREVLKCLINTEYFSELVKYKNYAYMDWNAIPSSPRELYVDSEIVHLMPNAGKHITFVLIPNAVGSYNRCFEIRVCPLDDGTETVETCDSQFLTTKFCIEYTCRIPEIIWDSIIRFDDKVIYAGQDYEFTMTFRNLSSVLGFIYYDVVPDGEDGVMWFVKNVWKYCISPDEEIAALCSVMFRKIGLKKLSGLVKFVGNTLGNPFHIKAMVLPVRVRYTPKQIVHRQKVLERTRTYVYIENATPTITWVKLYLKRDSVQYVEPMGAILAPSGQGFYVVIHTMFTDPEEIPLEFTIDDMPIFFSPNLRDGGIDGGYIMTNSEENYYANLPIFGTDVKMFNAGKRDYRISITRMRGSMTRCAVTSVRARITVTPKTALIFPGTETYIHITADSLDEVELVNEFRIRIVDQTNRKRVLNILFTVTGRFVDPQMRWRPKIVRMNYYRTHKFKEHPKQELENLDNCVRVPINSVKLQVLGPFQIKQLFEHPFVKELEFKMNPLESRELTIILKKSAVKDRFCAHIDGRILCWANGRPQKTLLLRVNVYNPELIINEPDLVFFAENIQRDVMVEIQNVGCMDAEFKWKKLEDNSNFIGQFDDVLEFSHQILDDLLCMLEMSESEPRTEIKDKFCKLNMTETYQRYLCQLRKTEDTNNISSILDEIIENLDLEHKRHNIKLNENIGAEDSMDDVTQYSSQRFVKKTIEKVLDMLKLEDSYDISEPSGDACVQERAIYFYEKNGVLEEYGKRQCAIHLPPIKKGYMQKAMFQLDVVGGKSHSFEITAVNLDKTIDLSKDSVYVGMKPWYDRFKFSVRARNVTEYAIKLALEEMDNSRLCHNISYGQLEITSDKLTGIPMFETMLIKARGILGFNQEYNRRIRVTINDSEQRVLHVRGQGIMPILSVTTKMNRVEQLNDEIIDEYALLQHVYFFDVFKSITEEEEEEKVVHEEENVKESSTSDYTLMSTLDSDASINTTRTYDRRFFKMMQSYVLVNNNEELPNATVLEQLIETEKFLRCLKMNKDTCHLMYLVYQDYVKMSAMHDEKMPINLKHFTVQPLPFQLHGHILTMNELKINQFHRFQINLHFFGPGKLIAAARTVIKIPGLVVDFKVAESAGKEFIYYKAEKKSPDFYDKAYRNMYEREMDLETDPKLKHAHSFDIDRQSKHQRNFSAKERKHIENYYNSLNKSVYMEHKHHYVLCKIFTNSKYNFSDIEMSVIVLVKPQSKLYDIGQMLEDYLYIDLHMGPTLPILLRGLITKN